MSDKPKGPALSEADAQELAELRAFKAAQQAASTGSTTAPEGTTLYVNREGEERYFTPETYALLAPDYAGFEVKPEKPAELPKAS